MKSAKSPPAPGHLTADSQKLWKTILADYEIDEAAQMIVVAALEARDRREEARAAIAKDGAVTADRWGQAKVSPWVAIERDTSLALMRAFRVLGFDQEARPPLGGKGKH
jgi:phage terminase small subunit